MTEDDIADARATAHELLDSVLDAHHKVGGEEGLLNVMYVLAGWRFSNPDNAAYADYSEALTTLRDIGESALNGQGMVGL